MQTSRQMYRLTCKYTHFVNKRNKFNGKLQIRTIGKAECVMMLQGHSRSMIFVLSKRAYATSY